MEKNPVKLTGFFLVTIQSQQIFRKSVSHACMNEHFFLEIYLERSHNEMKRSGIELRL